MRKWDQDETAEAGERMEKLYGREEAMEIDSRKLKDHLMCLMNQNGGWQSQPAYKD